MPQLKSRKGYSWWNPAGSRKVENKSTGLPRLFPTKKVANQAITGWFVNPNAEYRGGYNPSTGDENYDICTTDDGRKKEDLEIVPVKIIIIENSITLAELGQLSPQGGIIPEDWEIKKDGQST